MNNPAAPAAVAAAPAPAAVNDGLVQLNDEATPLAAPEAATDENAGQELVQLEDDATPLAGMASTKKTPWGMATAAGLSLLALIGVAVEEKYRRRNKK